MVSLLHLQKFYTLTASDEKPTPCTPSPCGSNAVCNENNGAGSCTCIPNYFGNPYQGCRPECVINSDCALNRACVNSRCIDPCPGTCGTNAECHVVNHLATCSCIASYTGNPYIYCILNQSGMLYPAYYCYTLQ